MRRGRGPIATAVIKLLQETNHARDTKLSLERGQSGGSDLFRCLMLLDGLSRHREQSKRAAAATACTKPPGSADQVLSASGILYSSVSFCSTSVSTLAWVTSTLIMAYRLM